MSEVNIEIITPEGLFFLSNAHMVTLPGGMGEFGVLYGHIPMVSSINPGLVVIYNSKIEALERFVVSYGFAEVTNKSVILLVEKAAKLTDFNLEDLHEKLANLKKELGSCEQETKALVQKNIDFTESILNILEIY